MEFNKKKFENDEVRVDGNTFLDCQFTNCVMVYGGGPPPTMVRCGFHETNWSFSDQAENTIKFMQALYHGMGKGGIDLIEKTFDNIRKPPEKPGT